MDKARDPGIVLRRRRLRLALGAVAALGLTAMAVTIARLPAALPSVDGSTIWAGRVQRGTFVRQVSGIGTLVPEETRSIPATAEGRVTEIPVLPGAPVTPSTVLVRLANPALEKALLDAQAQLQGAESGMAEQKANLLAAELDAQTVQSNLEGEYRQAQLRSQSDNGLLAAGLVPKVDAQTDAIKLATLKQQMTLGAKRLQSVEAADAAQIATLRDKVQEFQDAVMLARAQKDALTIRAGIAGVLESLNGGAAGAQLQTGQWVTVGTEIAKVVQPAKLKAEVQVAESDAGDVALNQPASIDTHLGIVPAHVTRIAPSAVNGQVTVDLALDAPPPPGARPDLSVDASIRTESLANTLFVGRPAFGQANQTLTMFKISPDGREARRVTVALGQTSIDQVQIRRGLRAGDWVVLSDTSAEDADNAIRFQPPAMLQSSNASERNDP